MDGTGIPGSSLLREPIALVGIGCRFPGGADNPYALWQLLCAGFDAITEVPADRWDIGSFWCPETSQEPGKSASCWGGFIEEYDRFDAGFFRISPREAAQMDPQQRLLLEVTWEALEDAGIPAQRLAGSRTGVFIGASNQDYSVIQNSSDDLTHLDVHSGTGVSFAILANRISYFLDVRGPSLVLDTACSSSLTALHYACRSLWEGECPAVLTGGVNLLISPAGHVAFSQAGMLSPDGRCRAFDAGANGYVRSEGAAMLVLKPLSAAIEEGDRIYATLLGTAVNQDGRSSSLTIPTVESQELLLTEGCLRAGIAPSQVRYVEAHGTGTPVGDPVEAFALGQALGQASLRKDPLPIGSIKTNIGHLEPASGVAGAIKTALCLKYGKLPPNIHFQAPNPRIPFQELNLRVVEDLEHWAEDGEQARVAAVCSFGFGGANAVALMGSPPAVESSQVKRTRARGQPIRRVPRMRVHTWSLSLLAIRQPCEIWHGVIETSLRRPGRNLCGFGISPGPPARGGPPMKNGSAFAVTASQASPTR